jgi:CheY-like chemotaxis protein
MTRVPTMTESLRVEVIDDEKDTANSMAFLLRFRGYEAKVAYCGQAALDLASDWKPHYVLLDIAMPGMNGLEVTRKLREQESETKIIAISGYARDEDELRAKDAGVDYYLVKPVEFEEIESLLIK